jgi:hypothetical protein
MPILATFRAERLEIRIPQGGELAKFSQPLFTNHSGREPLWPLKSTQPIAQGFCNHVSCETPFGNHPYSDDSAKDCEARATERGDPILRGPRPAVRLSFNYTNHSHCQVAVKRTLPLTPWFFPLSGRPAPVVSGAGGCDRTKPPLSGTVLLGLRPSGNHFNP